MPADHPNIDLHSHTTRSDGTLSPTALVQRARVNGVDMLALTDHDVLDGLPEAQMAAELERCGVPDAWEGALKYVGNPALISRSHFGRHLVALGLCASQREVFDHWLVPGKPGYVPQRWASLDEAVSWIRGAGGVAVLAHPARYRLDETRLWALAEHFKAAGGQGIEVVSGGHAPADVQRFAGWARRLGLAVSRASDFHDPVESRFDVGQMPPLPPDLTPIWDGWPELADIRA